MREPLLYKIIPAIAAVLGVAAVAAWLQAPPAQAILARVPGTDQIGVTAASQPAARPLAGRLTPGDGRPSTFAGRWPCFRGAALDGIAHDAPPLAPAWPPGGPRKLWQIELGEGHAGPAVEGGCVYLIDYDRENQADAVRCLSLDDGREIWRFAYDVAIKRNHGMSRTVPAVAQGCVVTLGPKGHVVCLDANSGELRWSMDLVRQFRTVVPPWYAGQCPLIDGNRVILAPAGPSVLMLAADLHTGQVLWKAPNPNGWSMTHTSIAPMEIAGRRTYVYSGSGGVAGIDANDGSVLWECPDWKVPIAAVATPVVLPQGRILLSGGYNAGSMMIQVAEAGGKFAVKTLWRLEADVFGATQHTPIYYDGYLYNVRPSGELVCLGLDGKIAWTSGAANRFGIGPFMIADGKILVVNDAAVLTMAVASPAGYKQLAQAKILDGHDSWGPMALLGGRLLVRDLTQMACVELADGGAAALIRGAGVSPSTTFCLESWLRLIRSSPLALVPPTDSAERTSRPAASGLARDLATANHLAEESQR